MEWFDRLRPSVVSVDTETAVKAFLKCMCTLSPRLFGPGTNRCKRAMFETALTRKVHKALSPFWCWHWNYHACESWGRNSELRKLGLTNLANKLDVPSTSIDSGVVPAHVSILFQKGGAQLEEYRGIQRVWVEPIWIPLRGAAISVEPEAKACRLRLRYVCFNVLSAVQKRLSTNNLDG